MASLLERLKAHPLARGVLGMAGRSAILGRFFRGSFWVLAGNLFWRLPSAVTTLLVARILGPVGFGEFGMVNSTVQTFAAYAGLRLGATSNRYVAEYRRSDPARAGRVLKVALAVALVSCLVAAVLLAVLAPWLAANSLNRPELTTALVIGAVLLFFLVMGTVQEYAINGFENFRATARVGILRGVATPLLCLPLAWWLGVEGAIAGLAGVSLLACAWLVLLLRAERERAGLPAAVPWSEARRELPVLWRFALPGMLTILLMTATTWAGRILLAREDGGYAQLGLFEAANQWRAVILFLPTVMARAILPILAESFGRPGTTDFRQAISLQVRAVCMATAPLAVLTMGLGTWLAAIFGAGFAGTEAVLPVLMASLFFFALNQSLRTVFDGAGRLWPNLAMHGAWAVVFLAASAWLVPRLGALALAVATLVAEAVLCVLQGIYVERVLAPGALRRSLSFIGCLVLALVVQYGAVTWLPPGGEAAVGLGLAALCSWPLLRRLRRAATSGAGKQGAGAGD